MDFNLNDVQAEKIAR